MFLSHLDAAAFFSSFACMPHPFAPTFHPNRRRTGGTDRQNRGIGTALHLACGYDHTVTALALIDRGASVHALDGDKMTPLCVATHRSSMDTIKALITQGNAPVGTSPPCAPHV